MRRHRAVLPVMVVSALVLAGSAFAAGTSPATMVTVKAENGAFVLSRTSVPLGRVTFVIHDVATANRDFAIAGHTSKAIQPGKQTKLTVTFTKAGKYPYRSTVGSRRTSGVLHVTA